jgi:predicted XRE-type DNA-binding protein
MSRIEHVTPAGGNVFADLGFAREEALALKAESDRIILEKLALKEAMMAEIASWIHDKRLKQQDAATILGVTRPRVSDVIRKKTANFSIDALVDMISRTGRQVHFRVSHHGSAP